MKGLVLLACIIWTCSLVVAQSPVQWSFAAQKKEDKLYEVRLIASIHSPWHIYSQTSPDGGPVPTKIVFNKHPLFSLRGKTIEIGNLQQRHEEVFDLDVKYFSDKVEFVQLLKLKSRAITTVTGSIRFMVCSDEQCLPPATVPFRIALE